MTKENANKLERLIDKLTASEDWMAVSNYVMNHCGEKLTSHPSLQSKIDTLALEAGWIVDMLNGKKCHDKGSLSVKIQKALGYPTL